MSFSTPRFSLTLNPPPHTPPYKIHTRHAISCLNWHIQGLGKITGCCKLTLPICLLSAKPRRALRSMHLIISTWHWVDQVSIHSADPSVDCGQFTSGLSRPGLDDAALCDHDGLCRLSTSLDHGTPGRHHRVKHISGMTVRLMAGRVN